MMTWLRSLFVPADMDAVAVERRAAERRTADLLRRAHAQADRLDGAIIEAFRQGGEDDRL